MAFTSDQQQPPVVQAIFDSLTRCFNPIDHDDPPSSNRCPRQSPEETDSTKARRSPSPRSDESLNASEQRKQGETEKLKQQYYDADRYIRRKLEIFRTTDEDLKEMGFERRPKKQQIALRDSRADSANTLVDHSSDDEIAHLAKAHKTKARGGKGLSDANNKTNSTIATFVRLLKDPFSCIREVQKVPLGLCFATPVRGSSNEDIANMSDWKLTAEEFAKRHMVTVVESSISCDDEDTITSALYFDQKYSQIPETNPPVPLFQSQRLDVSEEETEAIFKFVNKRDEALTPRTPPRHPSSKDFKPRSSPTDQVNVKKNRSKTKPDTATAPKSTKSGCSKSAIMSASSKKKNQYCNDLAPMGKSISVSTEAADELSVGIYKSRGSQDDHHPVFQSRLWEPDFVAMTAAEI